MLNCCGDGLGTKAIIFEPTAAKRDRMQIVEPLINQGFSLLRQMGTK
ncbi:hypothetical protein ACLD72_015510 [Paenibacillus sp. TH7-28]